MNDKSATKSEEGIFKWKIAESTKEWSGYRSMTSEESKQWAIDIRFYSKTLRIHTAIVVKTFEEISRLVAENPHKQGDRDHRKFFDSILKLYKPESSPKHLLLIGILLSRFQGRSNDKVDKRKDC